MSTSPDPKRELLRHTLATLAYRGGKTLVGAPENFGTTRFGASTRTPLEILGHIADLLEWGLGLAQDRRFWPEGAPESWDKETARFFAGLRRLDDFLASEAPLGCPAEKLFQGPLADALTHVGQIGLLRRMAGSPVRGENYFKADIVAGRVGAEQSTERVEFD